MLLGVALYRLRNDPIWRLRATAPGAERTTRALALATAALWPLLLVAPSRPSAVDVVGAAVVVAALAVSAMPRGALLAALLASGLGAVAIARGLLDVPALGAGSVLVFGLSDLWMLWVALAGGALALSLGTSRPALLRVIGLAVVAEAVVVCAIAVASPDAVVYRYVRHPLGFARIDGLFSDPNVFAATHAVLLALLLSWPRERLGNLAAALCALAVVAAGSRAALAAVALSAALVAIAALARRKAGGGVLARERRAALLLCALGFGALLALVVAAQRGALAALGLPDALLRDYDSARFEGWHLSLQAISPRGLLLGEGTLALDRRDGMTSPHLTLGRVLVDAGLLYWGAALAALAAAVASARRRGAPIALGPWWRYAAPIALLALITDASHLRVLALLPMLLLARDDASARQLATARVPAAAAAAWLSRRAAAAVAVVALGVGAITAAVCVGDGALGLPPAQTPRFRVHARPAPPPGATLAHARAAADALAARLAALPAPPPVVRGSARRPIAAHGSHLRIDVAPRPGESAATALAEVLCAAQPHALTATCRREVAATAPAPAARWRRASGWHLAIAPAPTAPPWPRPVAALALGLAAALLVGICGLAAAARGPRAGRPSGG